MATYLLKWDANRWDWRNLRDQAEAVLAGAPVTRVWSCGTARRIFPGDRVFVIRMGKEPRGIVASGTVTRGSFDSPNNEYQDGNKARGALCVEFKFDVIVEPRQDCGISRAALGQGAMAGFNWDVAQSGTQIPDAVASALENSWRSRGTGGAGSAAQQGVDSAHSDKVRAVEADAVAAANVAKANAEAEAAAEAARIAAEKAEAAKAAVEKLAEERAAAERAAAERLAAAKAAEEAAKASKVAAETAAKKAAAEKLAAEKAAADRAAAEKAARAAADKAAAEKAAAERSAAEAAAREKAAAEKRATEQATAKAAAQPTAKPAPTATTTAARAQAKSAGGPVDPDTGNLTAPTPSMYPAIVTDYFEMLGAELRGEMFSKADHRHRLAAELGLSDPDLVDLAFQQVSSVMLELGMPVVDGFRPLNGWPGTLAGAVQAHLESKPELVDALWIEADASKVHVPVELDDSRMVLMPTPLAGEHDAAEGRSERWVPSIALEVDFRARESRDEALATAGQRFVLAYERARLRETGFKNLVGKIEWVAQDRGDALGFHVRSFDEQGSPRTIIVKTTNYGARLPFSLTALELAHGLDQGAKACIYRVYAFSRAPRLFVLAGPFDGRVTLRPLEYRALL